MRNLEIIQTPSDALVPEVIAELVLLRDQADRFFSTQQSHSKIIDDVFSGTVLLTPKSLNDVNNAVMVVHQMTANAQLRINALRDKLPENYRDDDQHRWNDRTNNLLREIHKDFDKALKSAKKISQWASVKIDGTSYQE